VTGNARRWQFLPVSGRDEAEAAARCGEVSEDLAAGSDGLGEIALALQAGRPLFAHRRAAVVDSVDSAVATFGGGRGELLARVDAVTGRNTAFLLAGVGEHYAGMVAELYEQEPVFAAHVDECQDILADGRQVDVVSVLTRRNPFDNGAGDLARLMGRAGEGAGVPAMNRTEIAQPAVFVAEYALARMVMGWGVTPALLVGYSLGEYVAACLSGVMSLRDALRMVVKRADLIAGLPGGAMLAVGLSPLDLRMRVPGLGDMGVDIASVNGDHLVVAGPAGAIRELAGGLREARVACRELATTHAFHSRMLEPASAQLTEWVTRNVVLSAPGIPFVSNVTGRLATAELVTDPRYWARHMCGTVRFSDGLGALLAAGDLAFVEIGAGQSLGAMVRRHPECAVERWPLIVSTIPGMDEDCPVTSRVTEALAKLWLSGVDINWAAYHGRLDRTE
jgi:acyl transferase domain-containing protein